MSEFTEKELNIINHTARNYQADIDLSRVAELVNSPEFNPFDIQLQTVHNPSLVREAPPEVWAAASVNILREAERSGDKKGKIYDQIVLQYIFTSLAEASAGLQIIKDIDEFWRFKPTIEVILETDSQELEAADRYMKSLQESKYTNILRINKEELVDNYQQWNRNDLSTENINLGREIYEECAKIFERGFPNLLALKRVLDGKEPELEDLQHLRTSKVRRELTTEDGEGNSVYFDLIVSSFESDIRNGIAHNDIITDPGESAVHIPLTNSEYSYEKFQKIVKKNIANAIFLTGAFQSLIEWHAATAGSESRKERPDWVFEEQSFYDDLEKLDDFEFDAGSMPL